MIIAVNSPKHGLGQSVTAINLSVLLARQIQETIMMVDINSKCRDMEYYLHKSNISRGLDEFCSLYNTGMLSKKTFKTCINKITEDLSIMSSNEMFEMHPQFFEVLISYIKEDYPICLFDTTRSIELFSENILSTADVVVVVIHNSKSLVEKVINTNFYNRLKGKVIIVVNGIIERLDNKKAVYSFEDILYEFEDANSGYDVLPLCYNIDLKNECDTKSVLNFIYNDSYSDTLYIRQLNNIAKHILKAGNIIPLYDDVKNSGIQSIFSKILKNKGGI